MKSNYDFSKGTKNPYADKLKSGYTVTVHYEFDRNGGGEDKTKKKDAPKTTARDAD